MDNYAVILRAILIDGGMPEEEAIAFVAESLRDVDAYVETWVQWVRAGRSESLDT